MRRIALIVIAALVVAAALAGSAAAIKSEQKFLASVSPSAAGTSASPKPVSISVRQYFDDISADFETGGFALKEARVMFPKEIVFNGKHFPQCSRKAVTASPARCRKARIGVGKAAGTALGLTENLKVEAYNGPGGTRVELRVIGTEPLQIDGVIEARLTKQQSGKYGYMLTVTVPEAFTQKIYDTYPTLIDFGAKISAKTIKKGKKVIPYAGLTSCPGNLTFAYSADYSDNTTSSVEVTQPCTGSAPPAPVTPAP